MIKCPHDQTTLTIHDQDSVEILECNTCHGSWYSHDSIMALKKTDEVFSLPDFSDDLCAPQINGEADFQCPTDKVNMGIYMFHNVEINVCPRCSSIWLDQHEREKILANVLSDHGGREPWLIMEFLAYFGHLRG
ncbi:MAG: hypothetical protein EP349_05065 [Alphaproteobacteria bacterium]|nr:MAG: hypothetical protein EP349_05065 [Alphaproteobacteria bacterium]